MQALDVTAHSWNGCFVHGTFSASLYLPFDTLLSFADTDHFIVHVDSLGTPTWAAQFADEPVSMQGLPDGSVSCLFAYNGATSVQGQLVAGSTNGLSLLRADFDNDGALMAILNLPGALIGGFSEPILFHHDPQGGFALAGTLADSAAVMGEWVYGDGVFMARISADGTLAHAASMDSVSVISGIAIAGNGVVQFHATANTDEGFLYSIDADGASTWAIPHGFAPPWQRNPLAFRENGNTLSGLHWPSQGPIGGTSLSVSEFDPSGSLTAEAWAADPTYWNNHLLSLHALADGGALVSGMIVGALTFGMQSLLSSGPDGFVARISPNGQWEWVVTETTGNAFYLHAAPSNTSRIYTVSYSDGGVQFGSHAVPSAQGNFQGMVACLGDIAMGIHDDEIPDTDLLLWPTPATACVSASHPIRKGFRVVDMLGCDRTSDATRLSPHMLDVSRLHPGHYVLVNGAQRARFVRE